MPMLTTSVIRSPVAPRWAPDRTSSANVSMRSSTPVHVFCDVVPVNRVLILPSAAQSNVQRGPTLGAIHPVTGEHCIYRLPDTGLLGKLDQRIDNGSI